VFVAFLLELGAFYSNHALFSSHHNLAKFPTNPECTYLVGPRPIDWSLSGSLGGMFWLKIRYLPGLFAVPTVLFPGVWFPRTNWVFPREVWLLLWNPPLGINFATLVRLVGSLSDWVLQRPGVPHNSGCSTGVGLTGGFTVPTPLLLGWERGLKR